MRVRRRFWLAFALSALPVCGCRSTAPPARSKIVAQEPAIDADGVPIAQDGSGTFVARDTPRSASRFSDRHPAFYKPREYYEDGTGSALARTARATFLGVPAGLFGEVRQIVRGQPEAASF